MSKKQLPRTMAARKKLMVREAFAKQGLQVFNVRKPSLDLYAMLLIACNCLRPGDAWNGYRAVREIYARLARGRVWQPGYHESARARVARDMDARPCVGECGRVPSCGLAQAMRDEGVIDAPLSSQGYAPKHSEAGLVPTHGENGAESSGDGGPCVSTAGAGGPRPLGEGVSG